MEYCYNNNICPILCTIQQQQYPVCAVNTSGGYRRFNNECQFLNYACVNYDQGRSLIKEFPTFDLEHQVYKHYNIVVCIYGISILIFLEWDRQMDCPEMVDVVQV